MTISRLQLWAGALPLDIESAPPDPDGTPDVLVLDLSSGEALQSVKLGTWRASGAGLFLKVGASATGAELDTLIAGFLPDGVVPCGLTSPMELQKLDALLAVAETRCGLNEGQTRIALLVDNARIASKLQDVPGQTKRLTAVGWDGERLAESLRVPHASSYDLSGPVFSTIRSMVLIAARATGVTALDYAGQRLSATDTMMRHGAVSAGDGFDGIFCGNPPTAQTV
ncbi:aldolase/citrate lyase family protein [Rhizobium sp. PAMB 3174]